MGMIVLVNRVRPSEQTINAPSSEGSTGNLLTGLAVSEVPYQYQDFIHLHSLRTGADNGWRKKI